MSIRTININLYDAGGNPVNVDSVVVGTTGVVRTDTSAVVVSSGTPFVHEATGQYALTFPEPSPGLAYSYSYTYTLGAFSASDTGNLAAVNSNFISLYTSESNLTQKWGAYNIQTWSNKDGTNPVNEGAIQYALQLADAIINEFFQDGPFTIPFAFQDSYSALIVQDWANDLAAYELYSERGMFDTGGGSSGSKDDSAGNALRSARRDTFASMAARKGALRLNCARRWPTPTAPVARG